MNIQGYGAPRRLHPIYKFKGIKLMSTVFIYANYLIKLKLLTFPLQCLISLFIIQVYNETAQLYLTQGKKTKFRKAIMGFFIIIYGCSFQRKMFKLWRKVTQMFFLLYVENRNENYYDHINLTTFISQT